MPAKVPMSDTGTATTGMSVARTALQEQEDHQHDQRDRLDEGDDHLLDRDLDEARGVERDVVAQAVGEALGDPLHGLLHRRRHLEALAPGCRKTPIGTAGEPLKVPEKP